MKSPGGLLPGLLHMYRISGVIDSKPCSICLLDRNALPVV